ncbi:hypothetical protein ABZV29_16775 [Streptomyces sp. NPDC005236]|uniref:hypothetical protein n=1 Tax=Streptomyces sp. NPDC005236 TaxID=3157028 RepID=UPI0033AEA4C5
MILGDEVIAHIRARVAEAPDPSDELVEELRRIMTGPRGEATTPSAPLCSSSCKP